MDACGREKTVTAADVAKLAGVSQATVSRIFNKNCKIRINPDSRKRVLEAAEQLGYAPNAIAQIMASGRSGLIGIIVSDYFHMFYYQVVQELTNQLTALGLRTMLFTSNPKEDINDLMKNVYQYQVDGVIITSSALSHGAATRWVKKGLPVVLLNGYLPELGISAVQSDQIGSGRLMADYLARVGHTRFAYISSENSPHKNYIPRQQGFTDRLHELGLHDIRIIPAGYSYQSGLQAGLELLQKSTPPDAVFCSGDLNALGVIDAVRRQTRLQLGKDISVTGYDAPLLSELNGYSLTALTQQTAQLCEDCINLLRLMINDPEISTQVITHPMHLTIRSSSRPDV